MSALVPSDPSGADLAGQAVPLGAKPPAADTPLPPAELVGALDNAGSAPPSPEAGEEVATLQFVGDDLPEAAFTLRFPFRWEGARVDTITVRQLTTAQVGTIIGAAQRAGNKMPDLMDLYAVMTGLPAKVLRAIPATDMDPIVEKAFDFLPPVLPTGERLTADLRRWQSYAMRAAQGAHTPLDTVLRWPWHRMLSVWAEARDMHEESWGLLLRVWYRDE